MPLKNDDMVNEIVEKLLRDSEFRNMLEAAEMERVLIKNIMKFRQDSGLSPNDLAKKSGMSRQAITSIEKPTSTPKLKNFIRYINALGLEICIRKKQPSNQNLN